MTEKSSSITTAFSNSENQPLSTPDNPGAAQHIGTVPWRPKILYLPVLSSFQNEFTNIFSAQNFSVFIPAHSGLVLNLGATDYFLGHFFFLDASI